jgi:lipopolysaccharide transport protein LptA
MIPWQRRARLVIGISAVVFAVVVAFTLKRRDTQPSGASASRTDPGAIVEVTGGSVERFKLSREDVRVAYERQLTYADGSTKLLGVTIAADQRAGGRSFTINAKEGQVGQNESALRLTGEVRLGASDGLNVRTEEAAYSVKDGMVRAEGPVEFSRGLMNGSGTGMTYDTLRDVFAILDRAVVHVRPDERGTGAADVASGSVTFARRDGDGPAPSASTTPRGAPASKETTAEERPGKTLRFERDVRLQRDGQIMESDAATAYLTPDEKQIHAMALRGQSKISMADVAPGGLQNMTGRDMDLTYGPDGRAIERALLLGGSAIELAGAGNGAGRRIEAATIDLVLGEDGATPVAMTARESVELTLPADQTLPERTIEADAMDATGEPGRGLTKARFTGNVEYRERSASVSREATAGLLDVALDPGMAGFRDATFSRRVHFVDGGMTSDAAQARYEPGKGVLELTGSDPAVMRPRVVNEQLAIDATRIDVTLSGPHLKAAGAVKSVVQPSPAGRGTARQSGSSGSTETRLPSMFKQDRPANVTADNLQYDGTARTATYTGNAQLWQDETSLKAATIVLDDKTGDLTGSGGVTTVTVREPRSPTSKERVRSIATASEFRYEEAIRRATYTGKAHMNSTDGDITAPRIELYLMPSGAAARGGPAGRGAGAGGIGGVGTSDLERAEAYDGVTLRDRNRTTTGARLTYTTADERYVVTGTPVKVVDECRRETIGRTLTYLKSEDTITIDGNAQTRTQTKGSAQCP